MVNLLLSFGFFVFIMFATAYWQLWFKLGPSILKDIFKRMFGKGKNKVEVKNPEIATFLEKLNYRYFYIIDSKITYGLAHPFSKEVVVSSKIYNSGNTNLIKYVLAHEVAHKRQHNTKIGVIFFSLLALCFLFVYSRFHPSLEIIFLWAFIVGRIAMWGQKKFEDLADRETVKILGKENTIRAIKDLFILKKGSLAKRSWFWNQLIVNRDYPNRLKTIGFSPK